MSTIAPEPVSLSGLQHLVFCERQAALIHVERVWAEDAATAAGRLLHARADTPGRDRKAGVRIERAVTLVNERWGLRGIADTVEYHRDPTAQGGWRPYPVEYKRGRLKDLRADQVQLCAQALCLEEMHQQTVLHGALFYGESHRRVIVRFDEPLRQHTLRSAERLRALISAGEVPRVSRQPKCEKCSLVSLCLPEITSAPERARAYLLRRMEVADE